MAVFGNNVVYTYPASDARDISDYIYGSKFQMGTVGGTANNIVAYMEPMSYMAGKKYKAAIYDADKKLVATSDELTISPTDYLGWHTFNLPTTPTLTANAYYYLVVWGEE